MVTSHRDCNWERLGLGSGSGLGLGLGLGLDLHFGFSFLQNTFMQLLSACGVRERVYAIFDLVPLDEALR